MCIPIVRFVNDEGLKKNARKVSRPKTTTTTTTTTTEKQVKTVIKYPPKIIIHPKEDSPKVHKCKHKLQYLCEREDCSSKRPNMVIVHNEPSSDAEWGYSKSQKKAGDDGWGSSKSQKNDGWGSGSKAGGGDKGWGSGSNANDNNGWGSSSNKAKSNSGDKGWGNSSNKAKSTSGDNGWGSSSNKAGNDGWGSSSNKGDSGNNGWGSNSNKAKSSGGDNAWGSSSNKAKDNDGWGSSSNKAKSNDGWGSSSNKAAGNDGWGSSSNKAKSNAGGSAWGGASAIPVSNKAASNDGWGSASAIPANNDGWGNSGNGEANKNTQNKNNNKKENKKEKKQKNNNQNNQNNNNKQKNKNKNKNNDKNNDNNDGWGSSDKKKDTGNDGWGSSSNKAAPNDGWGGGASAIGGNGSKKAASSDGWGGGASAIGGNNKAASNNGWGATGNNKDGNDGWGSNSKKGSKAGSVAGWGAPEPIVVANANVPNLPPPKLAFDITSHTSACGSSCSGTSFKSDCSTCIAAASAKPTDFVQDIRGNWYQAFSGPLDKTVGDFIRGHDGRTYKKMTTSEREIMTGKRPHVHDPASSIVKRTSTYPKHSSNYDKKPTRRLSDSIPIDRDNFTVVEESYDEAGNLHIWTKRRPTSLNGPRERPQAIYPPNAATQGAPGLRANSRLSGLHYVNAVLGGGKDPTNIGPILRNAGYHQKTTEGNKGVPVTYVDQFRTK